MKKIVTLVILLLFTINNNAQVDNKQNNNSQQQIIGIDNPVANKEYPKDYAFNVRFHIVKNTDGTGSTASYGETELMNAMKILNTTFNKYQIFFKYKGFDVIQNTSYMRIRSYVGASSGQNPSNPLFDGLVQYSKTMSNPVYDYNAFNVFIVEGIDMNESGSITYTSGYGKYKGVDSGYSYNQLLSPSLPREIGKNLSLLRTFHRWNITDPIANEPGVEQDNTCESSQTTDYTNAGDEISDTQACPNYASYQVPANCAYTPSSTLTCNGQSYGTLTTVLKNFMSPLSNCRALGADYSPGTAQFTNGQGVRMRTHIANFINNTSNTHGLYNAKTTVASLYQPYKVIHSNGIITHKFQKGFTYTFPNAVAPDPSSATTNDLPINSNYTNDYQVIIDEVDTSNLAFIYQIVPINTPPNILNPNDNDPYVSGSIISSKTMGTGSYENKTLNEVEINDPNLENNLPSNKYHVITKTKQSGITEQKTIYKN